MAIYRLLLAEEIYKEMQLWAHQSFEGAWQEGAIKDMLRLKQVLPMPVLEKDIADMGPAIQLVLTTCESEEARNIPPANVAYRILMAFRRSQTYVPTLDQMMPLV